MQFAVAKELIMIRNKLARKAEAEALINQYFEDLCRKEYIPAYYYMGVICANGIGREPDLAEATKFYEKAAELEDPQACFQLAMM